MYTGASTNARWARRSLAGEVRQIKRWVMGMASSVGAYMGDMTPPSGGDQPETPPQQGDDPNTDTDIDEPFSDVEVAASKVWVGYFASNDEYSLRNLIDGVRDVYPDADIIEVYQEVAQNKMKTGTPRGDIHLTNYYLVGNAILENAIEQPYANAAERGAVKSRAIACSRPGYDEYEDDEDEEYEPVNNSPVVDNNNDNGGPCRGRGAALRRSIMARDSEGVDPGVDLQMKSLSMAIYVTVKIGGNETKKTLKEWLYDTESYIENECQNFMVLRDMFDFYSTQPEESVELSRGEPSTSAVPDRVSMPLGATNIMVAGVKLSTKEDPSTDSTNPIKHIYPTYIIREIPQFIAARVSSYSYIVTRLSDDLCRDLLTRTRFGLTTYKDDLYYIQSQIADSTIPDHDVKIYTTNINTALEGANIDLDIDVPDNEKPDAAHFYRLHSTAISTNANKLNTSGTPPLMHTYMHDIRCYSTDDADEEGYITIDLTRNSPFKDNEETYDTPYTTASIIAKFTRGENPEYAEGEVLYYLRPIHISKVSDAYSDFAGTYYPYALISGSEDTGYDTRQIQIYQCYTPAADEDFKLHLPARKEDDEYIKTIIDNMKESVKSEPTLVTDYGVRILKPEELAFDNLLEDGTPDPDSDPCFIWNAGANMTALENWRPLDGKHDIKIPLDKEKDENAIIVHYGLTFSVTGSVFGLPDPSDDISIDFFTNIDTYSKFTEALQSYTQGGRFFMFAMSPYMAAHGNPDASMVLVIDALSSSDVQPYADEDDTIVTARMYTCLDLKAYYNPPDPPAPDNDIEPIEPLDTGSIETKGAESTEQQDMEPLLIDWYFEYWLNIVGNPFPLTAKVIRDIFSVGDDGKANKIKSSRAIQFSLTEASDGSSKGFHRYLNNLILNYKASADDGGWDADALSFNLINGRWYAGQYIPPASNTRSIRRRRRARTNKGFRVL